MPITYTWTVTNLIGYPAFEGQTDVITRAAYTVVGDDGEGHTADYSNWQATPIDPLAPFIPFADLTNDIVVGWVQSNLGPERVASIQESIAIDIHRQVTPPPEPMQFPLPWTPPTPPEPVPPTPPDLVTPVVSDPAVAPTN